MSIVCIYIHAYTCLHVYLHVCVCREIHIYVYMIIYIYIYLYVHMYTCIYRLYTVFMYTHNMYVFLHTDTEHVFFIQQFWDSSARREDVGKVSFGRLAGVQGKLTSQRAHIARTADDINPTSLNTCYTIMSFGI